MLFFFIPRRRRIIYRSCAKPAPPKKPYTVYRPKAVQGALASLCACVALTIGTFLLSNSANPTVVAWLGVGAAAAFLGFWLLLVIAGVPNKPQPPPAIPPRRPLNPRMYYSNRR